MFEYELREDGYYIFMDNLKGKFGPFKGVFVRNKYLGNIVENQIDENKYPGYKYSVGISGESLFIIGKDKNIEILNI